MKLSIITLHRVINYGSVLQTYATQKIFEKLGHDVEFVDYYRKNITLRSIVETIMEGGMMQKYKKIWDRNCVTMSIAKCAVSVVIRRELVPMRRFLKKYITLTPRKYYSFDEILADVPEADMYITGSDQVWNSMWNQGTEKPYFLEYAPEGKRRIAFAASIGKVAWDENEIDITRKMLKKYSYIYMREKSGVELLKELGIESTYILDPTLILCGDEWRQIKKNIKVKKPYLLIYQLNKNKKFDEYAIELAMRNNWEIIRICYGYSTKRKAEKCIVSPSVEAFLGYIDSAACVLTDSFHATAFSLNLSTDFVSVLPEQCGTRIINIVELTGTELRVLNDYNDFDIINSKINHEKVQEILQKERKRSMDCLINALS